MVASGGAVVASPWWQQTLADVLYRHGDIAAAIDVPAHEALFWVMAMRRYGYLREVKGSDADGYFRYEPAGRIAR